MTTMNELALQLAAYSGQIVSAVHYAQLTGDTSGANTDIRNALPHLKETVDEVISTMSLSAIAESVGPDYSKEVPLTPKDTYEQGCQAGKGTSAPCQYSDESLRGAYDYGYQIGQGMNYPTPIFSDQGEIAGYN